jgi:hypothetical protein
VSAHAVEDGPPAGWSVSNVSASGSYDVNNKRVKWGPFFDSTPRTLTYDLLPPANATGVHAFSGTASADGMDTSIGGASSLDLAPIHPADISPSDYRIVIGEMTAYGAAWKNGQPWSRDPNPIPIGYLTRAGSLWKNGESYAFDPNAGSAPLWWVNTQTAASQGITTQDVISKSATPAPRAEAMRFIPRQFVTGAGFTLAIGVRPNEGVTAWAVEEAAPPVGTVSNISHGGGLDEVNGKIKWGPFLDNIPRMLNADIAINLAVDELLELSGGTVSYDGIDQEVKGGRSARAIAAVQNAIIGKVQRFESTDEVGFSMTVKPNIAYVVQVSADLVIWADVFTSSTSTGALVFIDENAGAFGARFYRAIEAPIP